MRRLGYTNLDNQESSNKLYYFVALIFAIALFTVIAIIISPKGNEKLGLILRQTRVDGTNTGGTNETVSITIRAGRLRGKVFQSRDGREYFGFHHIPYAKPPLGDLRFEPPQEHAGNWRGDRCTQMKKDTDTIRGSEDCLYLTVYTPLRPSRRPRSASPSFPAPSFPVIVYIFGGGFVRGTADDYGAEYFLDKDVVLVLPQFRVGIFANMNTEDDLVRGNLGFKDQVMALKWVQRNIARFAGDPKKVTIMGNSSGGMSVQAHLFSNMTKGLFHRAITQSGPAIAPDTVDTSPLQTATKVALTVGCTSLNTTRELVDCLKAANVSALVKAQDLQFTGFTVESKGFPANQTFLSDTPLNLLLKGQIVSKVPWIFGINNAESGPSAVSLTNSTMVDLLNYSWEQVAPTVLKMNSSLDKIRDFYFGGKPINLDTRWEYVNMLSDRLWNHPAYITAVLYAQYSDSPLYLYWLSYEGDGSEVMAKAGLKKPHGVSHTGELQYFFPWDKYPYIDANSKHANFSKMLVNTWAGFANGVEHPFILENGEEWKKFEVNEPIEQLEWMEFNDSPKMVRVLGERMRFWRDNFELGELYTQNVSYNRQ